MTAQGHPRAIFQRAIERGNLTVAEATLRTEIPRPTLIDLLDLTALIAFNAALASPPLGEWGEDKVTLWPTRAGRYVRRWVIQQALRAMETLV